MANEEMNAGQQSPDPKPIMVERLPEAAIVIETQADIDTGVSITDGDAARAYELLRTNQVERPEFSPTGTRAACFHNVEQQVDSHGGKMIFGWLVEPNRISTSVKNKFGDIALVAHAVWERADGTLVECTESYQNLPFVRHDAVKGWSQTTIHMMDDEAQAQKVQPGVSLKRRIVRI
jgi:hypothetical protein